MTRCLAAPLAVAVVAALSPAAAQAPLEDGTAANVWVLDADGAPTITYRVGAGRSLTASAGAAGVSITTSDAATELLPGTTAATEVLVNRLAGSTPAPTLAPPTSIVSLAAATADLADGRAPIVLLDPPPGSYEGSLAVTVVALAGPSSGDVGGELFVAVDGGPEVATGATTFTTTFVDPGPHAVNARAVFAGGETVAVGAWTLVGTDADSRDSDGDGLPDRLEVRLGTDVFADDAHHDGDGDGWVDLDEALRDTAPDDATDVPGDGDGDGWADWDEALRGTDPDDAASTPVAAAVDAVEYLLAGVTWADPGRATPHPGEGVVRALDPGGRPIARLPSAPVATFDLGRVPGGDDLVVSATLAEGDEVLKTWLVATPPATPARVVAAAGGLVATRAEYEAALAAYLVREVGVDLDPESGLATALCEAAVAWGAQVAVGPPVLLGEVDVAATPDAVARVAHAFPDLVDFAAAEGYAAAVDPAELADELFAPPAPGATTTAATAERLQRGAPGTAAAIARYHAELVAYGGWQRALDFAPWDTTSASDPWLPDADADRDGVPNQAELAGGPEVATDPLSPDSDGDGVGDLADPCPRDPVDACLTAPWLGGDGDGDGVIDALDVCYGVPDPAQRDTNGDGIGDACEAPARIGRPLTDLAVLAPAQVDLTARESAAATGVVTTRWLADGVEVSTARSFTLPLTAGEGERTVVVRLFAGDATHAEVEVDRRVIHVHVDDGPVPCLAISCDDGDPCSDDRCDLALGCQHEVRPGCVRCEGDADCDDGAACTDDACLAGRCEQAPLTGPACDDGDACTAADACDAGACVGAAVDCDDHDACTIEACDAVLGCVVAPDPAPDPILCPQCDADGDCAAGTCVGGLCCEANAAADGAPRSWSPGEAAPTFCVVGGTELHVVATSAANLNLKLKNPDGLVVASSSTAKTVQVELEAAIEDGAHALAFTATQPVTYTITESQDVFGTVDDDDTPTTITTTTAGAEATLTWDGAVGQVVTMLLAFDAAGCEAYRIVSPAGVVRFDPVACGASYFLEPYTLDEDGAWSLFVDPAGAAVGDFTATVWEVPDEGTLPAAFDGAPHELPFSIPGQTLAWVFDGQAGDRVALTMHPGACADHALRSPSGAVLTDGFDCGTVFTGAIVLTESGVYRWSVDPAGAGTPTGTLTGWILPPEDPVVAAAADGEASTLVLTPPGMAGTVTFEAAAGDAVAITFSANLGCTDYALVAPSGAVLHERTYCAKYYIDRTPLTETGTYRVTVDPNGTAKGITDVRVYDVPPDLGGTLTVGGSGLALAITTPGQNAAPTFAGAAGASVKIVAQAGGTSVYRVLTSLGEVVFDSGSRSAGYTSPLFVLPADDTYTLLADPQGAGTPSYTLTVTP